jgi:protein O-mannosyl-transferase
MTGCVATPIPQVGLPGALDRPPMWQTAFAVALLSLATIVAYANSFHGPLVFDDVPSIAENRTIQTLWPPWAPLFPPRHADVTVAGRPLANLTFAANYVVHGTSVWGYHLVNLGIHLAAGLTLFALLRSVIRWKWPVLPSASEFIPLTTSLLWLVHPLHTESVTYIVQRVESLAGLMYLFTMLAAWRAMTDEPTRRRRAWTVAAIIACTLGMATKETMVSAPLMVLLMDVVLIGGSWRTAWRSHRRLHVGLFATWLLLAALVITSPRRSLIAGSPVSAWQYLLTQCEAIVLYLKLTFGPSPLIFDYGEANVGVPLITSLATVWSQATLLVGLALGSLAALIRRHWLGLAGFLFFAVLAPSSSFIPIHAEVIAEHRMYLPLASVLLVAMSALWYAANRLAAGDRRHAEYLPWSIAIPAAVVFITLTHSRNHDYRSELALWQDTIAKRPGNVRGHYNLGTAAGKAGDVDAEIGHYRAALALAPEYPKAHNNLGNILKKRGDLDGASHHLERAISANPAYALAHYNLGIVRGMQNRLDEAMAAFRLAIRFNPEHFESHHNLGKAFAAKGSFHEAIAAYRWALDLDPDSAACWYNLGTAQLHAGQLEDAVRSLNQALGIQPDFVDAEYNLGHVLERLNQTERAIAQFKRVLSRQPDHAGAKAGVERLTASSPPR